MLLEWDRGPMLRMSQGKGELIDWVGKSYHAISQQQSVLTLEEIEEEIEGAINNGQFRETGNIGLARHRTNQR